MNTKSAYEAVTDPEERGAAMRLNMKIRTGLQKKLKKFEVQTNAPRFSEKAEKLVRTDFLKEASIEFSFNTGKSEVIATVTSLKETQ